MRGPKTGLVPAHFLPQGPCFPVAINRRNTNCVSLTSQVKTRNRCFRASFHRLIELESLHVVINAVNLTVHWVDVMHVAQGGSALDRLNLRSVEKAFFVKFVTCDVFHSGVHRHANGADTKRTSGTEITSGTVLNILSIYYKQLQGDCVGDAGAVCFRKLGETKTHCEIHAAKVQTNKRNEIKSTCGHAGLKSANQQFDKTMQPSWTTAENWTQILFQWSL